MLIGLVWFFVGTVAAAVVYMAWHGLSYRNALEDLLNRIDRSDFARPLSVLLPGFLILGVLLYPFRLLFRTLRWLVTPRPLARSNRVNSVAFMAAEIRARREAQKDEAARSRSAPEASGPFIGGLDYLGTLALAEKGKRN